MVKVVLIGTFVYIASESGLRAATEQTVRDLVFADDILAGGEWLINKFENKTRWMAPECRCKRWGVDLVDE